MWGYEWAFNQISESNRPGCGTIHQFVCLLISYSNVVWLVCLGFQLKAVIAEWECNIIQISLEPPKGLVYSASPPALPIDWLIASTFIPGHVLYLAHKKWKCSSDLHRFHCLVVTLTLLKLIMFLLKRIFDSWLMLPRCKSYSRLYHWQKCHPFKKAMP